MAQANVQGQWSTLPYLMPINPVHVALMHNGRVLVVSGSGNDPSNTNLRAAVWDPQAGTITTQTVAWDMFCNGMVVLPDGRPFINGGTLQYDPFHGQPKSSIFDPSTNTFTDVQNMAHGRWYPTVTTLGDGRVMTFSGANETGATDKAVEIYIVGLGWSVEYLRLGRHLSIHACTFCQMERCSTLARPPRQGSSIRPPTLGRMSLPRTTAEPELTKSLDCNYRNH